MKIGFIGAGKIAQALAMGFIKMGTTRPELIMASCLATDQISIQAFQALGSKVVSTNQTVAQYADVLILSVKPQIIPIVISDIQNQKQLILSLAMGVPISYLEMKLPRGTPVIRVMPNTPAAIGCGATVFIRGSHVNHHHVTTVQKMFSTIGSCHQIYDESVMDIVTALAGSGPAYIYIIIECLADGAVNMGMPRQLAYQLATQTVIGAATMVKQSGIHPAILKDDVTSPAGSTIAAIHHLERHKFRSALIGAIQVATLRSKHHSNNFNFSIN